MSIFLCQRCDQMRDSDDGCAEGKSNGLICIDCMNDMEDEIPEDARVMASGVRGHSYAEIYEGLTKAGCPEDLADELAREKSK